MVKNRIKEDIGPSTDGLALPDELTMPYPLRVQAIYVHAGDYVKPDTHPVYTLMDGAGAQHTVSFDHPGQVTRVLVRPGQIFRKRARVFEFCCDSTAVAFSADVPPSKVKRLSAPPIRPRAMTSRPAQPVSSPEPQEPATTWRFRRKESIALVGIAALIAAVALFSRGELMATGRQEQPVDSAPTAIDAATD